MDLPVLAHEVCTRAGSLRPRRLSLRLPFSHTRMLPSAQLNVVGTLIGLVFATQYSTHVYLWQRFARGLAPARHDSGPP